MLQNMASRFEPHPGSHQDESGDDKSNGETEVRETKTISLSELHLSREELLGSLFLPIAQSAPPEAPSHVVFARPQPFARTQAAPPPSVHQAGSQRDDGLSTEGLPTGLIARTDSIEAPASAVLRQATISGSLEFADGLALSNPMDRVVVYRELDGEAIESGAVWLREGRYEIFVEETAGLLIGELRTPYGDIIGRGSFELAKLPVARANQRRVEAVALRITPVVSGISGRVASLRSDLRRPAVKGVDVEFRDLPFSSTTSHDGRYEEPKFLDGSSAIVKATHPGYWGTLTYAHAGAENNFEIFPDRERQMMRQLVSLSRSAKVSTEPSAIVWGRVLNHGRPVAGARVELPTTQQAVDPIYFNESMVPDASLKQTSANGMYAFFPVPAGSHAVQAALADESVTDPLIFPAEIKTVTRVDIETRIDHKAKIKVFDAFQTALPLAAEIASPGSSRVTSISPSGVGEFKFADAGGVMFVDVDSTRAYERIRLSLSRDPRMIYAPMIRSMWLEKMRGSMKMNPEPHSGTVVGFIQGSQPYKIALEERSLLASSRVLYFDARGEVLNQDYGQPGGGFVVFNVPEGFRTITVQPSGSAKMFTAVTLVEARVTNVISHWLR